GGVGLQGSSVLGGVIGRNPSVAGCAITFAVIFSFFAANALWYQPGLHPHPIFRTRDPEGGDVALLLLGRAAGAEHGR
ncbi:peptidoglycan-binding protein, partial [Rhizobium leguminosarum]